MVTFLKYHRSTELWLETGNCLGFCEFNCWSGRNVCLYFQRFQLCTIRFTYFDYIFRCPTFSSLTPGCTLKTDPKDSCCLVEVCPQPTPGPHQTTPVPTILPKPFTGRVNLPIPSPVTGHEKPAPKPIGKSYTFLLTCTCISS